LLETARDGGECGADILDRHVSSYASDDCQLVRIARAEPVVRAERQPDLRPRNARSRESLGGDANDGERVAVDSHRASNDGGVCAALLPEPMADDGKPGVSTGPLFARDEWASEGQPPTKHVEVVGCDRERYRASWSVARVHTDEKKRRGREIGKHRLRAFSESEIVRVGETSNAGVRLRARRLDLEDLLG